jgi:hypothetical protein
MLAAMYRYGKTGKSPESPMDVNGGWPAALDGRAGRPAPSHENCWYIGWYKYFFAKLFSLNQRLTTSMSTNKIKGLRPFRVPSGGLPGHVSPPCHHASP